MFRNLGQTVFFPFVIIMAIASVNTESLLIATERRKTVDDQKMLNYALKECGIKWQVNGKSIKTQPIDGQCHNGPRVTLLPHTDICRRCGNNSVSGGSGRVYVWHQLTKKSGSAKIRVAKEGNVWFLKSNWMARSKQTTPPGILKGIEWLVSLSVP